MPYARLAIEVDGESHAAANSDTQRDAWFASQAIDTLRFWNSEITGNLESVLQAILAAIAPQAELSPPGPLPQEDGEH